jgi:hypothetical protein
VRAKPGQTNQSIPIRSIDWLLALLSIPVTTFVLSHFALLIEHHLSIRYTWVFELCMVLGQIVFQSLFIFKRKSRLLPYAVQLLKVSLLGSVLLIPMPLANSTLLLHRCRNYVFCAQRHGQTSPATLVSLLYVGWVQVIDPDLYPGIIVAKQWLIR